MCCFAGLASALAALGDELAETAVSSRIQDSLNLTQTQYNNRMDFATDVMLSHDRVRMFEEPRLRYTATFYVRDDQYDVVKEISKHITLLQLEDVKGSISHSCTVVGKWIFDSNFAYALPLSTKSLDLICSTDEDHEDSEMFMCIYRAVKFVPTKKHKRKLNSLM